MKARVILNQNANFDEYSAKSLEYVDHPWTPAVCPTCNSTRTAPTSTKRTEYACSDCKSIFKREGDG